MIDILFCLPLLTLTVFDGGASGGAAGTGSGTGAATGDGGTGDGAQGETNGAPVPTRRGKSGENILYGKQDLPADAGQTTNTADTQTTSNTIEDRRKAFNDIISGEYKDLYTEEVQRIIDRRFKETKTLQETVNRTQPIVDMLMQRYGVSDVAKLQEAIESDDSYWEEAADEAGMSVEQYRQFQKLQRENKALLAQQQERQNTEQVNAKLQDWYRQADALKETFPDFDLSTEAQNPEFISMLKSGVPVEHAYKVLHMDEITSGAIRKAEKAIVSNIRAKGQRPRENGVQAKSTFTVKDDVSQLSKKDRADIARRVARGEIIRF